MKKIILIICCLIFVTGCYNYHELDSIGIVSSIFIDYQDNTYNIQVEMLKDSDKSEILDGTGSTLNESIQNAKLNSNKELFYNHLNAVIITQNVDVYETVKYLFRNPKVNNTFAIVVCDNKDVYQKDNLGKKIKTILKQNSKDDFFQIAKIIYNDKQDLFLPYMNETGQINEAISYRENTPVTKYNLQEIAIHNLLTENTNSYYKANCGKDFVEISINKIKKSIDIKNSITITFNIEATIEENTCDLDTTKVSAINKIEKMLEKEINKETKKFIDKIIINNSDILGINQMLYDKNHNLQKKWQEYNYKIKTNININRKGLLLK